MGCDIHITAERKTYSGWESITESLFTDGCKAPFYWRAYGAFGFLAGVRNYSNSPLVAGRRGWPNDASNYAQKCYENYKYDAHSAGWLTVDELRAVDYEQTFYDERDDEATTLRNFLGPDFMNDLEVLHEIGADRIVFFFDN